MTQPRRFDRRAFLKLSGVALGASLPLVSPAIGLASLDQKLKVAQETRMLMGTVVAVTVVDPSADLAQEAMNQAFLRMATLAPLFDRHAGSGPVVHLNAQGQLNELPPELRDVLGLVAEVSERSGGAFDITVAPLVDAFTRSYQAGRATTPAEIRAALAAVGGLQLTPAGLVLTKENAAVTLDGVAKGFIADQGLAAAARAGARRVLINAGGDVAALGERQEGRAWQVAVSDPAEPEKPKVVTRLRDGAIATSGNYEVYFDRERLFHHIVDPHTGRSPRTDVSVSVRARTCALADTLSTTCFVLEPPAAMRLMASYSGVAGLILTRQGQRIMSPGFLG